MRRLLPYLCAFLLLLPLVAVSAQAQEGPLLTSARQLDLVSQHLATSAEKDARAGRLTPAQLDRVVRLAALVRGFHFDLESHEYSGIQAQAAWAEVAHAFVAARNAVGNDGSRSFHNEVLREHALMNRLDRRMGGAGFWHGKNGWTG